MKIEKDAEWLRLETEAKLMQDAAYDAARELTKYAEASAAAQLGLVPGETVVKVPRKGRFLVARVGARGDVMGKKLGRDGKPTFSQLANLYTDWRKE
jgi:hypothetical protein